mgnify:CR=1 FL=1
MNILITILLIVLAIIIALLISGLFVKSDYEVNREVIINKPVREVFDYIKLLRNQDNFSKWAGMDPDMKKDYKGIDGEVGFVSSWESNNKDVGKGEQEILKIIDLERIDFEIRFIKPFKSISSAYMITDFVTENHTKVIWGFSGKMSYPMNIMLLFMNMEKMIGKDFETGLNNLKNLMEKN